MKGFGIFLLVVTIIFAVSWGARVWVEALAQPQSSGDLGGALFRLLLGLVLIVISIPDLIVHSAGGHDLAVVVVGLVASAFFIIIGHLIDGDDTAAPEPVERPRRAGGSGGRCIVHGMANNADGFCPMCETDPTMEIRCCATCGARFAIHRNNSGTQCAACAVKPYL